MLTRNFINRHTYIWTHKLLYTHILIPKPKPKPKEIIKPTSLYHKVNPFSNNNN